MLTSFIDRSYFRSLEIIKKEREKYGTGEGISDSEIRTAGHSVMIVRFALVLLSVTFIIVGILGGDTEDVLGKAIRICTECIGLG